MSSFDIFANDSKNAIATAISIPDPLCPIGSSNPSKGKISSALSYGVKVFNRLMSISSIFNFFNILLVASMVFLIVSPPVSAFIFSCKVFLLCLKCSSSGLVRCVLSKRQFRSSITFDKEELNPFDNCLLRVFGK